MTVALYKLATQESHDYLIDGNYFYFKVVDEKEVTDIIKDGWSLTTTEASEDNKPQDAELREELIKRLNEAGVKFHPNSKTETLQAKVDELD